MSRARSVPAFDRREERALDEGERRARSRGRSRSGSPGRRVAGPVRPTLTASSISGKTNAGTTFAAGGASARPTARARCADLRGGAGSIAGTRLGSLGSASSRRALERASGLGEEDVVERRRVQLEMLRRGAPRRRARARRRRARSSPPSRRTRRALGDRRHGVAEALERSCSTAARSAGSAGIASTLGRPISALSAAGVPSATMWPWSMIPTRSARTSASSRYCVVRKTVTPSSCASRATSAQSAVRLWGSRPVVGSSRKRMLGRWTSASARSSRRFIPPE